MYFRLLGDSPTTYSLELTDGTIFEVSKKESGKIECSAKEYRSLETLLAAFPGASLQQLPKRVMNMTHQITTKDGETYKIVRDGDKFKFWGKTTKVIFFDSFEDIFVHLGDLYFKKIESFENPELICTDSKGKFVATVRANGDMWDVLKEDDKLVHSVPHDLHKAMEWVLTNTSV